MFSRGVAWANQQEAEAKAKALTAKILHNDLKVEDPTTVTTSLASVTLASGKEVVVVRIQRIITSWHARQQENQRRAAQGLPPRTRRRRRKTLATLTTAPP